MIHYHGTPITPGSVLEELSGKCFFVSHAAPAQVKRCHELGQSIGLDNGAFSKWKTGRATDWKAYYRWAAPWLEAYPATWAVIPDIIDAPEEAQDELLCDWPFGDGGAPVWHLNEDLDRLVRLCQQFPRVCVGSTAQYYAVMSEAWRRRMDTVFSRLACDFKRWPNLHMLRGMRCSMGHYPFTSVDSTDVARNHNRKGNALEMANRWDRMQPAGMPISK